MKSAVQVHADEAARAAGVEVRALTHLQEQQIARSIFDEVWPGEGTQITPNLLQALSHNGAYVSAAFDESGKPIGAAFAFPGVDDSGLHLHSHMTAVLPDIRNQNVGRALKLHQRAWALENGYHSIRWTFDPLVRRNARLNVLKLGVDVLAYYENFYGEMPDAVNAGDFSDRLMVEWNLNSDKANAAAVANLPAVSDSAVEYALVDFNGVPTTTAASGERLAVALPEDIVSIRSADKKSALAWRLAVRATLTDHFSKGWTITGLTETGSYVLERA